MICWEIKEQQKPPDGFKRAKGSKCLWAISCLVQLQYYAGSTNFRHTAVFLHTCLINPPCICLSNRVKQLYKLWITHAVNKFMSTYILTSSYITIHQGCGCLSEAFNCWERERNLQDSQPTAVFIGKYSA